MHLSESYTKKEPGKSMAKIEKQRTNIKEKKFIKFRKIRKIKRKNEENKIEIKKKFEYIPCKTDKSEQSKDLLYPNIIQKENCIFNESIKFQITKKRKSSSEVNKYQLKEMKKVHTVNSGVTALNYIVSQDYFFIQFKKFIFKKKTNGD